MYAFFYAIAIFIFVIAILAFAWGEAIVKKIKKP
jgi:hypothetical protein